MLPRVTYKDVTLGNLLGDLAQRLPDHEALVYPDRGLRWTFADLEREAAAMARGLVELGIARGDRVALWATNVPEWVVLELALAKAGAILVTVNTAFGRREVEYLLGQSRASTLFLTSGARGIRYLDTIREIDRRQLPELQRVVTIGEEPGEGMLRYRDVADLGRETPPGALSRREAALDVDDVVNMQYTSGTTGFPKGVMLTHRNILNNGSAVGDGLGYTPADRLCLPVPLFHCFGCVLGVLAAYTHGATLVPLEVFDARRVLEHISGERCTAVYGVPTMFIAELEDPELDRFDLTSLRTGIMAGALCPVELLRRVIAKMHLTELVIAYGLTEASPVVTLTSRDDTLERRTETVGRVLPGVEVRIVDPGSLQDLKPGEQGELWTRGYHVMKGYYCNEKATREAITPDGWLRSGDLATIDTEGYVVITGRIKDMIIRGGENIYPKEIEDQIRAHPAVSDVAVYGVPSRRYGEEVAAAVKLRPGACATREEIAGFCQQRLARYKVPRYVQFVEEFPLTASGKIQKYVLRERAAADFALAAES